MHRKFEQNFVEKSRPKPIKQQATTHHAQHTTHDIQHTTRPIEFTRATRSTSIFTTRQEAAETSHMQHATYISGNTRYVGELPLWTPPYLAGEPVRLGAGRSTTPKIAPRRLETPQDATKRHDETLRDATRRHKTSQDVSETPREVIFM